MRSSLAGLPLVIALCLAWPSAAQSVLRVGPGQAWATIGDAVAAAVDGDIVLVSTGTYPPFSVVAKTVHVVADAGAMVMVSGTIEVVYLTSSQTVTLRGLQAQLPSLVDFTPGLRAHNNDGVLWLEDCVLTGAHGNQGPGLEVVDCAAVLVDRCTLQGGVGVGAYGYVPTTPSGSALVATDSSVQAWGTTFTGGEGAAGSPNGAAGGAGANIEGTSAFYSSDCEFIGGKGGDGIEYDTTCCFSCGQGGAGGYGLRVAVGAAAKVLACQFTPGAGGPGILTTGYCADNGPAGLPSGGGGTIDTLQGLAHSVRVTSPVSSLVPGTLIFFGEQGEKLLLIASINTDPVYLPKYKGPLVGAPIVTLPMGVLGSEGFLSVPITSPGIPVGIEGLEIFLQAGFLPPVGAGFLGAPSALTMLP